MIFIVLNAVLAAYLIWTSVNVNTKKQGEDNSLINILLLNAGCAIIMFLTVSNIYYGPERIVILLDHVLLFLVAALFTEISIMFISNSKKKKGLGSLILRTVLLVIAGYIALFKIHIEEPDVFGLKSDFIFSGNLARLLPFTWLQLFVVFYVFFLPTFSFLIMLIKSENANSRLSVQRAMMSFGAIVFTWVGSTLMFYISDMLPMMRSLFMYILSVTSIMLLSISTQEKIYDASMIFTSLFSMVIKYVVPAVVGAILCIVLREMAYDNPALYTILIFAGIYLLMLSGRLLSSFFTKVFNYRSNQYEKEFEKALASIDYENELANISQEFLKAFRENMQTTTMTALIDSGSDEYTTVFDSEGKNFKLPKVSKAREVLMNNDIHILFKEEVETNYLLKDVADELTNIFEESESEVLIILNEGRHILGILLLGEKTTGGSYDEYDKQVLTKFYSYFFVFGYYMKNIANASVVGTVNREIRMSAQIITSIQENMDYIRNPKIDVGYLMVPAHNIGGEFVDLIRLNDTSHIMVIGSLSGKGISASMSMVILKSIVRTFLADTHDFKQLIQKVNAFIRFNLPIGTYFSGLFCLMDFATDTLYYVNCGIPTMLEYSKTYNNVIEIQGKGYILGFVKDITPLIKVKQVKLVSGDMLAISTNGLINSHSLRGDQFGKERIKQTVMDNYTYPANRIARFVYDNLQRFMSKELEDDITMLVIKYYGKDYQYNTAVNLTDTEVKESLSDDFDVDALLANAEVDSETVDTEALAKSSENNESSDANENADVDTSDTVGANDNADIANNADSDSHIADSPDNFDTDVKLDDVDISKDDVDITKDDADLDIDFGEIDDLLNDDMFDSDFITQNIKNDK